MGKSLPAAARHSLKGRVARLESLFRNLFFPIVVVAAGGTIRLVNVAAAAYLEGTPEDFVGKSIRELVPENAATYLKRIRRILKNHRVEHFENLLELPAGKKWFHSVWQVVDGGCAAPDEVLVVAFDITEKKLKKRTRNLEEANTALRVLIEQRKRDVIELEEKIASNVEVTILPFIKKLKNSKISADQRECVDLIESNLKSITSPFSTRLSSAHVGLTPTEIQVANLVKLGYTTKQIALRMNVSVKTTDVHRLRIRKKLGIDGKKINLRTFLLANLDN